MRTYWVYITASFSRKTYVGVTNNIQARMRAHRNGESIHTNRYAKNKLVYIESTNDIRAAISREKQIKGWGRSKKIALIESQNPNWEDFAAPWFDP